MQIRFQPILFYYVMTAYQNHLEETFLMGSNNIGFGGEINIIKQCRKIITSQQ